MTQNIITDDIIRSAIEEKDDPEHEEALTVQDARRFLEQIQQSLEEYWSDHLDGIDEGHLEIVHEDRDVIVLADNTGYGWNEELDAAGVEDDIHRTILRTIHHSAARELTDYSWSTSNPFVFVKSALWQTAEQHVRRSIAKLTRESGSVARGVDRWATERQGLTLKKWGDEHIGTDRPHQTISKNARRGRENSE